MLPLRSWTVGGTDICTHTSTNTAEYRSRQQRIWERWRLYPAVLSSTTRRPRVKASSPATPVNSSPPTPTSLVGCIKKEVVRKHPKAKNPGTLATSSTSIAFSVCSPSCYPSNAVPNEPGSSKRVRLENGVWGGEDSRIEITKETSDIFLPLKAVAGALAVLIKNYELKCAQIFRPIDR